MIGYSESGEDFNLLTDDTRKRSSSSSWAKATLLLVGVGATVSLVASQSSAGVPSMMMMTLAAAPEADVCATKPFGQ
eukprot:CAMPEP_0115848680 /NCGR_PEP_ID=MMETSP0287-20121206/11052_1 /TAXON_ID=412157 /ORGANISM="Chrysochromulina rotalis, Strain UIO044" /LENGTH=76 /DNA_ID=CAMNT_0003302611 /DNA_START=56 /DNA_END=283 /DNA_ORIENTATION=+